MASEWATDAEVAAYDAASGRTFGRPVTEAVVEPLPWRTGEPGVISEAEDDDESGLTFGRFTGSQEAEVRRRVEEARRQREIERQLLDQGPRIGWTSAARSAGASPAVAESVRFRAGLPVTGGGQPARPLVSERRTPPPTGTPTRGRVQLREVTGWEPKPPRPPR